MKSEEYTIIYNVFNQIPNLENNIAGIIEEYIYQKVKNNVEEYILRFDEKHGSYIKWWSDTNHITNHIYIKCNYKYNKLDGERLQYSSNGFLFRKEYYLNGLLDGFSEMYYPSTTTLNSLTFNQFSINVKSRTYYIKGIQHGQYMEWYRDGSVRLSSEYNFGHLINKYTEYYSQEDIENGNTVNGLYVEMNFNNNGVLDGILKKYNEYGVLIREIEYKNGEKHGCHKNYSQGNGSLIKEMNYKNGLLDGDYKTYLNNGKCLLSANYLNGKLHSKYKTFYINEQTHIECEYKNGYLDGEYIVYDKNGEQILKKEYNHLDKISLTFLTDLEEEPIELDTSIMY